LDSQAKMKEEKGVLGLSKIRRNRGISLEQIAQSTKISVRCLEAIEQGEFAKLPGGIYNTSYIKQYARAIDYDEGAILAVYQTAVSAAAARAQTVPSSGKGTFGGFRTVSGILGL
jgi:cytoskeletal protein RodZ